ncbi:ribulose bisphosphate carboxylase small subunit [Povalibacter sp.]|uniref:ribulose bisphosphate carboxylase small subunit n=1 Tax=Povalibacter sp. TaxID=1962978 RepID=UPI002F421D18
MRITQGTFSFLRDLTDEQIRAQIGYALGQGWAMSVEFTDDPHPRNTYWEMWDLPMFDVHDAAGVMYELNACRKAHPGQYIRLNAFDATRGFETVRLSFIVNRPKEEPELRLTRTETQGRSIRYSMQTVRESERGRT